MDDGMEGSTAAECDEAAALLLPVPAKLPLEAAVVEPSSFADDCCRRTE